MIFSKIALLRKIWWGGGVTLRKNDHSLLSVMTPTRHTSFCIRLPSSIGYASTPFSHFSIQEGNDIQ